MGRSSLLFAGRSVMEAVGEGEGLTATGQVIVSLVYLLGALGNTAALYYLFGSKSRPSNSKHALMLRCLAANDLVAVIGMWALMNIGVYWKEESKSVYYCGVRALWRMFGLGSGCVVIVMAVERWFALTRPFFYQKHVTLSTIRWSILGLWCAVVVLVAMPLFGFGAYHEKGECVRYKLATTTKDRAYAYLYLTFGTLLCCCLVWCNVAVMRCLVASRQAVSSRKQAILVRRISRNRDLTTATNTEELAFAKIMGLLCLVFVICWLPQLMTIPLSQLCKEKTQCKLFLKLADFMLALHFVLDPYFYILQRWPWFRAICKKKSASRINSVKTSNELCTL